jgi:hypothetical protein
VPVLRKYFKLLLILLLGGFIHRSYKVCKVHKGALAIRLGGANSQLIAPTEASVL